MRYVVGDVVKLNIDKRSNAYAHQCASWNNRRGIIVGCVKPSVRPLVPRYRVAWVIGPFEPLEAVERACARFYAASELVEASHVD